MPRPEQPKPKVVGVEVFPVTLVDQPIDAHEAHRAKLAEVLVNYSDPRERVRAALMHELTYLRQMVEDRETITDLLKAIDDAMAHAGDFTHTVLG